MKLTSLLIVLFSLAGPFCYADVSLSFNFKAYDGSTQTALFRLPTVVHADGSSDEKMILTIAGFEGSIELQDVHNSLNDMDSVQGQTLGMMDPLKSQVTSVKIIGDRETRKAALEKMAEILKTKNVQLSQDELCPTAQTVYIMMMEIKLKDEVPETVAVCLQAVYEEDENGNRTFLNKN
jgi:hypothetical protein